MAKIWRFLPSTSFFKGKNEWLHFFKEKTSSYFSSSSSSSSPALRFPPIITARTLKFYSSFFHFTTPPEIQIDIKSVIACQIFDVSKTVLCFPPLKKLANWQGHLHPCSLLSPNPSHQPRKRNWERASVLPSPSVCPFHFVLQKKDKSQSQLTK